MFLSNTCRTRFRRSLFLIVRVRWKNRTIGRRISETLTCEVTLFCDDGVKKSLTVLPIRSAADFQKQEPLTCQEDEPNLDLMYGRWQIFGEWITQQRMIVSLTQQQAATAVKVSRRQWIRYELGAKVPLKRMRATSKLLHVTEEGCGTELNTEFPTKGLPRRSGLSEF